MLTGLSQHDYRTVCVGGVTYFSRETPLGSVLPDMFHQDLWRPEFCSPKQDSTRHQVDQALAVAEEYTDRPLFLFVNVSATHVPHGHYLGESGDTWGSSAALAYADEHLGRLVDGLSRKRLAGDHVRRPRRRLRRGRLPRAGHRPPDGVERAVRGDGGLGSVRRIL